MPDDGITGLPADDESPSVLLADAVAYMQENVDGWQPSVGSPDYAILAAGADEEALQYALLREDDDTGTVQTGLVVYGLPAPAASPAFTTAAFTARDGRPGTLTPGTTIAVDAAQGTLAFEVVDRVDVAAGATATGVLVQAVEAGAAANGASGTVDVDQAPSWLRSVQLEAPAAGGSDAPDQATLLARIRGEALLKGPVVHADDLEIALPLRVPTVDRALVRDNFDDTTGEADVEGVLSVYPLDAQGEAITSQATLALCLEQIAGTGRRILNGVTHFGVATYTTYDVGVEVILRDGYDETTAEAAIGAAVAPVLDPALFAAPAAGEIKRWVLLPDGTPERYIYPGDAYAAVKQVDGVQSVPSVTLTHVDGPGTVDAQGRAVLAGNAPLPRLGTVTVTFVQPS